MYMSHSLSYVRAHGYTVTRACHALEFFFSFCCFSFFEAFLSLGFRGLSDTGCAGPKRLYLNANDGNAFGPP